jgi:hypothetical protein
VDFGNSIQEMLLFLMLNVLRFNPGSRSLAKKNMKRLKFYIFLDIECTSFCYSVAFIKVVTCKNINLEKKLFLVRNVLGRS